jgi:hypothetical protein
LTIREALAAAEPGNTTYQRDVSVSYQRLADLARQAGDTEEAEALLTRAYQAALPEDHAREQLRTGRGTQFDPDLVDLFLSLREGGQIDDLAVLGRSGPARRPS